ncbi:ureidoglycolate lyase [Alphaproteobacteria bacterium]|jgi:ureidoglycolate lyase|nr:ureidoglycolate lyase [Alphaproteobacteria bacterium]
MAKRQISIQPMDAASFASFGDVLTLKSKPDKMINQDMCGRHHDLAKLDFTDGQAGISLFDAVPRQLPYTLDMMERHPLGSQAFIPLHEHGFLVIVAPDMDGKPGEPLAFLTAPGTGINIYKNTWHGVLTPLQAPGMFAVIDRIGNGANLEEYWLDEEYIIQK